MDQSQISGRIYAVGDIHGMYDKLTTLVNRLPFDPDKDLMVFLGDYINRGPESSKVLDFLIDFEKTCSNTVCLIGNHEHILMEYSEHPDPDDLRSLRNMGIEATLESYGKSDASELPGLAFMPASHRNFLKRLRPYFRTGKYLFVHAWIAGDVEPENVRLDMLLNSRPHAGDMRKESLNDRFLIFGHTPFETPFITESYAGLDTGAVYGNMLTAIKLPEMIFFHS